MRDVRCAACEIYLYSTNGCAVQHRDEPHELRRPICLTVGNLRVVVCSRPCAYRWLAALTDDEIHSAGYLLF